MPWRCDNCNEVLPDNELFDMPVECPKCDYYHCGDLDCCYGEGFKFVAYAKEIID